MKKLVAVLDLSNRYRNALYFGTEKLTDGNSGLESIRLDWKGKRAVLVLELTEVAVSIVGDGCPELLRYDKVNAAKGDSQRMSGLNPNCELLRTSANACDGCAKRPLQ